MKPVQLPSGTDPQATADSIVAAELKKLQDQRNAISQENKKYIEKHPELATLIDQFVSACISHKPHDIVKFGAHFFNDLRKSAGHGPCPVVFAGPSGVGKGTLVGKLMSAFPNFFGFSVSHTTRAPRPGEENGVHYHFVNKTDMEEAVDRGEFIEHAKVHTNMYGTSIAAVEKVRSQGKICVLDIDVQGVQNVKKSSLEAKYIFINTPSMPELEKRLRGRGTETAEKIKVRIDNAKAEIEFGTTEGNFDAVVVNDDLEQTFSTIVNILQSWYPDFDLYVK